MRTHPIRTLAVAALLPAALAMGTAPVLAAPGNNGTIKLSEVGGPENSSNDPKLSCTFEIQWYGFDAGADLYSDVTFGGQGADAGVGITVTGSTHVFIGEDAAGGGTDHDATQVYTLAFDAPPANAVQGYHVKVETANGGSQGNDKKSKVFHVQPCGDEGGTGSTPAPEPTTPPAPEPTTPPFDWNWQYGAPTCTALTVDYPADIPSGQANDVNVRFETATGSFTLNFHHNTGTWAGHTVFTFADHPQWPAGLTTYDVVWVQVGGTNYHWQGRVSCVPATPPPTTPIPPFDWNWEYPAPTCTALDVTYPANIPAGQANDANIRFESNLGQFTLNFHHNTGTWSGAHSFTYASHPQWPAGVTWYRVVWTQVGGTNYHWQGSVACGDPAPAPANPAPANPAPANPAPANPAPAAVAAAPAATTAQVTGFRTTTTTVKRGAAPKADLIAVSNTAATTVRVQQLKKGRWTSTSRSPILANGAATVTFPKLTKKGTYKFRVVVDRTATKPLVVKVR